MEQTTTGQTIVAGNAHRFDMTFLKRDGTRWDLTDYLVSVEFRRADGVVVSRSATKYDQTNSLTRGVAYYDNPPGEFDANLDGNWSRAGVLAPIADPTKKLKTLPILFVVEESP